MTDMSRRDAILALGAFATAAARQGAAPHDAHHAAVEAVAADRLAGDADVAGSRGNKSGDHVEQGRLAATRRADEAKEFRSLDVEADAGDGRNLAGRRVVGERNVADFDVGHDLRAAVIDGMRVCRQTRRSPPGRVSLDCNRV